MPPNDLTSDPTTNYQLPPSSSIENENVFSQNKVTTFFSISPPPPSQQAAQAAVVQRPAATLIGNFHQRSKSEQFFKHFSSHLLSPDDESSTNQSCSDVSLQTSTLNATKSKSNDENNHNCSFVLPVGTVKRQVESINFKNKSTSQDAKLEEVDLAPTNPALVNLLQKNASPDSKRFKWELLKKSSSDSDRILAFLSESEFNRTKKIFEQLQGKKSDATESERKSKLVASASFKSLTGEKKSFKSSLSTQ